jgi:hypothetical protein
MGNWSDPRVGLGDVEEGKIFCPYQESSMYIPKFAVIKNQLYIIAIIFVKEMPRLISVILLVHSSSDEEK